MKCLRVADDGLDTGFLVSAELVEHPDHAAALATLSGLLSGKDRMAFGSPVLAEFIHIVTDSRRFRQPVAISEARRIARQWWTARDVEHVFPNTAATQQFGLAR